jgi:hypothetical protein
MERFARIWGAKWTDHIAASGGIDAVADEWRKGLDGMTGESVKIALNACRQRCTWPPTIAEFRQAASDGSTPEQRAFRARERAVTASQLALPAETWGDRKERGAAKIAAIKAMLKGGTKPTPRAPRNEHEAYLAFQAPDDRVEEVLRGCANG